MKTALVLAGGGSKGAYEAGCMKALQELGYHFDIVTGTSIGALNGLLICQQDFQALYHLWDTITSKDVFKDPINFDFSIESMLSQTNLIVPFFKSYIDEKGADITPLKNLIHALYNEEKVQTSPIDYGIVTVKYPSLKPLEITKKEMKKGEPVEYAIASASCFPAFPIHYIEKQGYIDGGYYDNVPISLALKMGAEKIIVIELGKEPTHDYFENRPNILSIRPYHDLGGFLDFSRDLLDKRVKLGYYDTLKTFQQLKGYRYTFEHDVIAIKQQQFFYYQILYYEDDLNHTQVSKALTSSNMPLTSFLLDKTYKQSLSLEDYSILALETTLEVYGYSYMKIYTIQTIGQEVYQKFLVNYQKNKSIYQKESRSLKTITEYLKGFSTKEIISYLYHLLVTEEKVDLSFVATLFTKEMIIALYFYTMKD